MLTVLTGIHSSTATLAGRLNGVLRVHVALPFNRPKWGPIQSRKAVQRVGRKAFATSTARSNVGHVT